MVMQTVSMRATATGRVATAPRAPASLGGKGAVVRRSAPVAPLRSDFLGVCSLGGLCSALAGMALAPLERAVRGGVTPFMVECNNKKGKGATVAKITNRKRARVSGFRVRMSTANGRKVIKARRAKGRKVLAPGSVFGTK